MALKKPDGTTLTKTTIVNGSNADTVTGSTKYTLKSDVFEDFKFIGRRSIKTGKRLRFKAGQTVTQAEIDDAFGSPEVGLISPRTGAPAGGAAIVITGQRFKGVTGVTFGGTAGTAFSVIDHNTIVVTTPAKTAGTYDVVLLHPDGNITVTGGFTYA